MPPTLSEPRRVLILLLGRIGDFIVATPAIKSLRDRFPGARLVLATGSRAASLARLDPNLDEVLEIKSPLHPLSNLAAVLRVAAGFDLAVDLNPSFSRSASGLLLLSRAPVRVSFEKRHARRLYTTVLPHDPEREHFMDRYARLAAALGAPFEPRLRVYPRPEHVAAAERDLAELGLEPGRPLVAVHPGNFKKLEHRWPEEKFRALTERILALKGPQLVYLAGPGEAEAVEKIITGLGVKLQPPQPLPVAAAFLARLDLLVCTSSGPLHLAAAVGCPTFSFESRYDELCWRPRGPLHDGIVGGPSSCRDIEVDAAWAAPAPKLSALTPGAARPPRR